jgi:signal peptidase
MIEEAVESRVHATEQRPLVILAGHALRLVPIAGLLMILLAIVLTSIPLFGYRAVVLGGGSMEPALQSGSLLISRAAQPYELESGDVVTFQHPSGGTTITHRILSVREESYQRWFTVKGDANRTADPDEVAFTTGRAYKQILAIPYVGYPLAFIGSTLGTALMVLLPLAGLAAMQIRSRREKALAWQD